MTMTWPNKSPEPTAVGAYLFEKVSVVPCRSSAVAQLFSLGHFAAL